MNKHKQEHLQCTSKIASNGGFTIVELLIVIVVIAILAAISIVAYTGIQQRAYVSKVTSVVNTASTALAMYKAENGGYPSTAGSYFCVGTVTNYPQTTQFDAGACDSEWGDAVNEDFNAELLTYISAIPDGSMPTIPSAHGGFIRGISYHTLSSGQNARLLYQILGDQDCPIGSHHRYDQGTTACEVLLADS